MKWREFLTIKKETDTYAVVADPDGGRMIVRPAGLDEEIQHNDETPEAVAEYDEWCLENILDNAVEIYGVDLEEVADIINRGGEGKALIIEDNGKMSVGVLPPRYGGYCFGSPGSPWACFDLGHMHEKLNQMTADALSSYIHTHIFAFCGCTVVYCP